MNQGMPEDCKPQMSLQGDYTFTDRELQDVLGFLEMMNGPGSKPQSQLSGMPEHLRSSRSGSMEFGMLDDIGEFVSRPAMLPPPSAGLQFQPRLASDPMRFGGGGGSVLPEAGVGASGLFSPTHSVLDQSRDATSPMNFGGFGPGVSTTVNGVGVMTLGGGATVQEPRAGRADPPGERDDGPAKVSHGASEKQRRDRINSMIDQLRRLVPPGGGARGGMGSAAPGMPPPSPELCALEGKRSKYVVLAETIQLVTLLTHQVKEKDAELEQLRRAVRTLQHSHATSGQPPQPAPTTAWHATDPMETSLKEEMMASKVPSTADMDALPARASPAAESPALPEEPGPQVRELEVERDVHAFHGGNEALSVVIDKSPNHCYIKVTCKDRRGLLSDILTAIAPLPLEVKRAAITTSASNIVTDIFEVKLDEPNSLSSEDLRQAVLTNLYHMGDVGVKRKK